MSLQLFNLAGTMKANLARVELEGKPRLRLSGYANTFSLNSHGLIIKPSAWDEAIPPFMEFPHLCVDHNEERTCGVVEKLWTDDTGLASQNLVFLDTREGADVAAHVEGGSYRAYSMSIYIDFDTAEYSKDLDAVIVNKVSTIRHNAIVPRPSDKGALIEMAATCRKIVKHFGGRGQAAEGSRGKLLLAAAAAAFAGATSAELGKSLSASLGGKSK